MKKKAFVSLLLCMLIILPLVCARAEGGYTCHCCGHEVTEENFCLYCDKCINCCTCDWHYECSSCGKKVTLSHMCLDCELCLECCRCHNNVPTPTPNIVAVCPHCKDMVVAAEMCKTCGCCPNCCRCNGGEVITTLQAQITASKYSALCNEEIIVRASWKGGVAPYDVEVMFCDMNTGEYDVWRQRICRQEARHGLRGVLFRAYLNALSKLPIISGK